MREKILVVDDEESICEILKFNLQKEGYEVECAYSAEEALRHDIAAYDLLLVDIMMDTLSGFDLVKRMRYNPATEEIPVIFCSALNSEDTTVMGLNIGADDFITKPFVIGEVIARVRAVLRRSQARKERGRMAAGTAMPISNTPISSSDIYESDVTFRELRIDRNEKAAYLKGRPIELTRTEFDILLFFLTHRNRIYSRKEIIDQVWTGDVVSNRTVDVNVTRLRKKLGEYGENVQTRVGFGYGFKETL